MRLSLSTRGEKAADAAADLLPGFVSHDQSKRRAIAG